MTALRAALAFVLLWTLSKPVAALTIHADYAVSVRSFPVGAARISAEISKDRYSIVFSGGISGLARLFSDAKTNAEASGRIGSDRLEPQTYSHVWTEDDEVETVSMQFARRGVTAITLDPPRRHPERYLPLTPETNADALDLVSAFLWPVAGELGPAMCDRSLPLIDGKRRFDIAFAFARTEKFVIRSGPSMNAIVCTLRYRPVAGQRIGKNDASITDSSDNEVWMAPVAAGLAAPVRIQFRTRAGRIVLRATSIGAE